MKGVVSLNDETMCKVEGSREGENDRKRNVTNRATFIQEEALLILSINNLC